MRIAITGTKNSRKMTKKSLKAQITVILVFIMAVLFLFTLISININKIAQKKTTMSNLTDSVSLRVASQLGSMGNALKQQYLIFGDELSYNDFNWRLTLGGLLILAAIVIVIVAIIGLPVTGGASSAAVIGAIKLISLGVALGISGGFSGYLGYNQQTANINAGMQESQNLHLKSLSAYQQMLEGPINGLLYGLVDDAALVKDKFDLDRDGDTQDYIPRFFQWYISRLNSFESTSDLVRNFNRNFFHSPSDGPETVPLNPAVYRFHFKENPDTKMVLQRKKGERWKKPSESPKGYWVDWWVNPTTVAGAPRSLDLVPWFHEDLRGMLAEMRKYGYGINVDMAPSDVEQKITVEGEEITVRGKITMNDNGLYTYEEAITNWESELEEFEVTVAKDLHDMDLDSAVQGLDSWLSYLYQAGEKKGNWYARLGALQYYAQQLRDKLEERARGKRSASTGQYVYVDDSVSAGKAPINYDSIHECVYACTEKSWACCGTPVCSWSCCGSEPTCGRKCKGETEDDEHCYPGLECVTPVPSGSHNGCCSVLKLEPYLSQAVESKYCSDNIVDVYGGHSSLIILDRFISDCRELRQQIKNLYDQSTAINQRTYNKMHEVFYVWVDKVGGATTQPQEVGHIVFARIEGMNPAEGFALPRIQHTPHWFPPYTRVELCNGVGSIVITAARFDEDTSKQGPLNKFWTFRASKFIGGAGGAKTRISADNEAYVRSVAKEFQAAVMKDKCPLVVDESDTTTQAGASEELIRVNMATLKAILKNHGMVSKVKVHYGPGYTPDLRHHEIASPAQLKKDIYIQWTSANFEK